MDLLSAWSVPGGAGMGQGSDAASSMSCFGVPSSTRVCFLSRVSGHALMAAEPTVSDGVGQVSTFNENEAVPEELGGLALFCCHFLSASLQVGIEIIRCPR